MNRRQQRVMGLILIGTLAAGALVGGGWWLGQRSDRQPAASGVTVGPSTTPPADTPAIPDTSTAPAPPTSQAQAGSWQGLPAAPIPGGSDTYAGVWTGNELLLHGPLFRFEERKYVGRSVGAAYQPATRTWRRLPPMPEARTSATVTWNGREMLVVGGLGRFSGQARPYADGVAYSPASNAWRRLPAMDSGRVGHTAVCTGRQLLVWGGRTRTGGSWTAPARGLAYDRAANRWSPLPRSPLRGRTGHLAVWTGSQMLIWGGIPARHSDPEKPFADGAAYTPYPL